MEIKCLNQHIIKFRGKQLKATTHLIIIHLSNMIVISVVEQNAIQMQNALTLALADQIQIWRKWKLGNIMFSLGLKLNDIHSVSY